MLHRTDMHYYNIEEIGMRNRYYRTAAIKAAVQTVDKMVPGAMHPEPF